MKWKVNMPITLCNESKIIQNIQTVRAAKYSTGVIITEWMDEKVLNPVQEEIKLDLVENKNEILCVFF